MQEKSKHGFAFALVEVAWGRGMGSSCTQVPAPHPQCPWDSNTRSRAPGQWTLPSDGPPVSAHNKAGSL